VAEIFAFSKIKGGHLKVLSGEELAKRSIPAVRKKGVEAHNADITYFFIEKSGQLDLQRLTYSRHKGTNLLKVAAVTTTDGRFEGNAFSMFCYKEIKKKQIVKNFFVT
jgi:hypothetical protein